MPATVPLLMNPVVDGLDGCAVYIDDIVVFGVTSDEHIRCVDAPFGRLAEAHLTVDLAKCEFAGATVTYVGRVVRTGGGDHALIIVLLENISLCAVV